MRADRYGVVVATAVLSLAACSPWSFDNPNDPNRCDPSCSGDLVCFEGTCVAADTTTTPDGGPTDAGVADARAPDMGIGRRDLVTNGDFSAGLSGWTNISAGCSGSTRTITVLAGDGPHLAVLELQKSNAGGCGGQTGINLALSADVSGDQSLVLHADLKAISSSTTQVCGAQGQEPPLGIRIGYVDALGSNGSVAFNFHWGTGSCANPTPQVPFTWVPVQLTQNSWHAYVSANIFGLVPNIATVTSVIVLGMGWDYHGRADNVALIAQ